MKQQSKSILDILSKYTLSTTAKNLLGNKKIHLISKNPDKYVNDLKTYFNLEVNIKNTKTNNKNTYIVELK